MKQILVPIDFSVESDHALNFACELARKNDSIVDVLNVFKAPESQKELSEFDQLTYIKQANELNWKRLTDYLSQKKFDDVQIRMNQVEIATSEKLVETIVSMVSKNQSDLIIMGNKPVSGFLEMVNDSIAALVMKGVDIPFLSIKGFVNYDNINHILYTSEYQEDDGVKFEFVKLIADLFKAKIHFLYIDKSVYKDRLIEKEILLEMKQLIEKNKIDSYSLSIREGDDVDSEIDVYLNENPIDLVVVGYHGDRVEKHNNEGSIAEDFIHSQKCPVLTIKH